MTTSEWRIVTAATIPSRKLQITQRGTARSCDLNASYQPTKIKPATKNKKKKKQTKNDIF